MALYMMLPLFDKHAIIVLYDGENALCPACISKPFALANSAYALRTVENICAGIDDEGLEYLAVTLL